MTSTKVGEVPAVNVGFRVSDNSYRVFVINNWVVVDDRVVEVVDGNLVCTCSIFRASSPSKCSHTLLIKKFESMSVESVCVSAKSVKPFYLDSSEVPDIHLDDIVHAVLSGIPAMVAGKSGKLNAAKLYTQCLVSYKNRVSIIDLSVKGVSPESISSDEKEVCKKSFFDIPAAPQPWEFYVDSDVWSQCCYAVLLGENILITGPSGTGKSTLCYYVANALNLPIEPFSCGAMSEPRSTLIGNTHFSRDKGTWFAKSRFVKALTSERGIILLDELTRAVRGAFNILLPLLDEQKYLSLDESEDACVVHRGRNVAFMATANIGAEYTGTDSMDKSLKDRFNVIIDMTFPPKDGEVEILHRRCNVHRSIAEKLVAVASHQRNLADEGEFMEKISTRMLLSTARQVSRGVLLKTALRFCILNHFSNQGGAESDRAKIAQIFQKNRIY